MYFIDIIWEILKWIWENRNKSFSFAAITSLLLILIDKFGRKLITNQLKRLFHVRDKSEFSTYVENQRRIESKLDALMRAGGVSWDAHYSPISQSQNVTDGQKNSSKRTWVAFARVLIIGAFTFLTVRFNHSRIRGESTQMKKKLLSRKFILALATGILVILNDGLDLGLQTETIMYVVGIVATWIVGEAAVDVSRKSTDVSDVEKSYHGE